MITNFDFEKNIKKIGNDYFLEINIPNNINNFIYKIYGDQGFIQHGKITCYKNIKSINVFTIIIDKIQTIFFTLIIKNEKEYYDFINMKNYFINKNIKMDIKREVNNNELLDRMIEEYKENNTVNKYTNLLINEESSVSSSEEEEGNED
jgi:hypothetical protein